MPRPRKPPPKPARQRDYKHEYEQRVKGTERGSAERQRARGHAGPSGESHRGAADLLRYLRPGTTIICDVRAVTVDDSKLRRFRVIPKRLVPPPWSRQREREFVLRGPGGHGYDVAGLRRLIEQEQERGAEFSPQPSLDQRRLIDY